MNSRNNMYNRSGYLDMTAYIAMKNIEREEAKENMQSKKYHHDNRLKRKKRKGL